MDYCHTSDLISLEQALEKMLGQLSPCSRPNPSPERRRRPHYRRAGDFTD